MHALYHVLWKQNTTKKYASTTKNVTSTEVATAVTLYNLNYEKKLTNANNVLHVKITYGNK